MLNCASLWHILADLAHGSQEWCSSHLSVSSLPVGGFVFLFLLWQQGWGFKLILLGNHFLLRKGIENESFVCVAQWHVLASQVVQWLKTACQCRKCQEMWVQSLGWEDPLEKEMATTQVFLPGKSMGSGAWRATVHGVAKSRAWLSNRTHTHDESYV